jgi:hypothetical protein
LPRRYAPRNDGICVRHWLLPAEQRQRSRRTTGGYALLAQTGVRSIQTSFTVNGYNQMARPEKFRDEYYNKPEKYQTGDESVKMLIEWLKKNEKERFLSEFMIFIY